MHATGFVLDSITAVQLHGRTGRNEKPGYERPGGILREYPENSDACCHDAAGTSSEPRRYRIDIGIGRLQPQWVGVDLNTTGHAVVAAEPVTGTVLRLGKTLPVLRQASKKCTKLYHEGKLWKLKKCKSRERRMFKSALNRISRQIVSFAEAHSTGIKLEKLFSDSHLHSSQRQGQTEFSFGNGSFPALQMLIERRADEQGIPVLYVDAAFTSKRCSRCGGYGRRVRKRFECPLCGAVIHADVNAALNIAMTPHTFTKTGRESYNRQKKRLRRKAGDGTAAPGTESPLVSPNARDTGFLSFLE